MRIGGVSTFAPIVYLISRPSIKSGGASLDVTFRDPGVTLDVRQRRVLDREVLGVLGDTNERLGRRFVILLLHQQQESIQVGCVPPAYMVRRATTYVKRAIHELPMSQKPRYLAKVKGQSEANDVSPLKLSQLYPVINQILLRGTSIISLILKD